MARSLFISNSNMDKSLSILLTKGIIFLAIIFLLDRGIGSIIRYYLIQEKQGDSSITTYALNNANEDVIIFGSSRAAHHYVPAIIKEKTNLTAVNVGRDGMNLSYYYALLQGILSHHTPKVVILDLNPSDFQLKKNKEHVTTASLLPYINENQAIGKIIKENDGDEFWKAKISMLYRYNSLPASILQHNLGIGQKNKQGYEALKGNKLTSITDTLEKNINYQEDSRQVRKFEQFITTLRQKSVILYVVISPSSRRSKFNCKNTASRILSKYGLELYDYSGFSGDDRLGLFYDGTHMNDSGAHIFTKTLVQDLMVKN